MELSRICFFVHYWNMKFRFNPFDYIYLRLWSMERDQSVPKEMKWKSLTIFAVHNA